MPLFFFVTNDPYLTAYSGLDSILTNPPEVVQWIVGKVNPVFEEYGCELLPILGDQKVES